MDVTDQILATHTVELFQSAVQRAVASLRAGEVVALPTETVYGLAGNALDPRAVARIFEIKGRPAHNPIIVHVASLDMARRCASKWPALADKVATAFWPGPLTMVLPRSAEIPDAVTAHGPTVGLRWPSHPFIQAVIREGGFPLAAPSANPSGHVSPTNAAHVRKMLGDKISLIVDGGQSQVGIESTVVDLSVEPPRLLRPGMIHAESLLAVTGQLVMAQRETGEVLQSPGLLPKHYAPKAKVILCPWKDDTELITRTAARGLLNEQTHIIAHTNIPAPGTFGRVSVIPRDPDAFARALYAELHRCDEQGARWIVIETLPETPAWRAIADRLRRATAE